MNNSFDFVQPQSSTIAERISVDTPVNYYLFLIVQEGDGRLEAENLTLPFSAGHFFLAAPGFSFGLLPTEHGTVSFFSLLVSEEITLFLPGEGELTDPLKQFLQAADGGAPLQGVFSGEERETLLHYEALLASAQALTKGTVMSDESVQAGGIGLASSLEQADGPQPAGGLGLANESSLAGGPQYAAPILRHLSSALLLFAARRYRLAHAAPAQGRKTQSRQKLADAAMELIQQRYTEELTLSSLADALFTSPSYLCRIFKEVSGTTVSTYLNQVRIANVKRLLRDTDELIVDIASACGYNYIPYFNQLFKRMVGVTPTEYRRLGRGRR